MVGNRAWSLAHPTPRQSSPYDGFTAEDWDQAGIGQVRDALEALLRVPGWEDAEYFDYFHGIEMYRTSPQLQPTLTRLIGRLRDMVRQNPSDYRGWEMLGRLSSMLPAGFADALTEGLESVPGTSGTEEVVPGLACGFYIRIQDWPGLERYTAERWSRVLARPLSASPALRRAELSVILPVLRVGIPRVQALVMLGRAGEARSVLQECRHLSGSHWSNLAPEIARQATRWDPKQERPAAVLQEILDLPPVESPPQPKPEPFRLVLAMASGGPAKLKQFQTDPLFADWRSDELNWGMLGEEERALLRDVWPLGQVHGWALLQGRRVLETGLEPPSVERVAAALSRHGEPQADLVRRFLKQEPDRLDAQQRYISLLEPLLPNARLEADLLPRLQAWGLGLVNQGSYRPAGDPEAWSAAALRVLPRLEAGLERRPQSGRLWNRWMFWSQFHPRSAKPHTLLSGLPILPVTSPAGSLLNINILHRVVEALRQRKAWTDLAAWCAAVWELDQRRRLAAVINRPTGIRSGYADPLGELREVRDLVLKPWEEALIQMGGTARLKQLQGELKAMGYKDPGPRPRELN
jgi:hypothetical protein